MPVKCLGFPNITVITVRNLHNGGVMLSPNPGAITSQVTSDYRVNNYLMAWGHTLLNTNLYPVKKKPAWFDKVATELTTTQETTQKWLTADYPEIAAVVPQTLIQYANKFAPTVEALLPFIEGKNPQGSDRQKVVALLKKLHEDAKTHRWRVLGLQQKVIGFTKVVMDSSGKMIENAKEVKKTISAASKDLLALQSRIAELQQRLGITTTEAKHSMSGAAMTGASITMTMLAFTVGAAAFPIVGLAGAIIGIAINAAKEAAESKEVLALIHEIGELQIKLGEEQFQTAALETVAASFENLADVCSEALTTMDGTVHHWEDIVNNVGFAVELVEKSVDISNISAFQELRAAKTNWATIKERCLNIEKSGLKVGEPIIVGKSAA
jgi:hypothetical protein